MPAFLHEDLFILEHVREKDGIKVDVHEVLEIRCIAAGHRIHRLIREGHGIEEGIEGPFDEFDEGFLEGELAGAAKRRMFADMGHARAVRRRRAERNGKDFIVIIVLDVEQAGTGLDVVHFVSLAVQFRDIAAAVDSKAVQRLLFF